MIQARHMGWGWPLKLGLATVICLAASANSLSQERGDQTLLAAHVPAGLLTQQTAVAVLTVRDGNPGDEPDLRLVIPRRKQRWERFERNFAVEMPTNSMIQASLTTAKHQLDRSMFTVQGWLEDFQEAVSFDYEVRQLLPRGASRSLPWQRALEDARLRSDANIHTGGAFVGIRLVVPLGD